MEQVLERKTAPKYDWRTIEMYDDEGKRITNERTLRSMAEGMEFIEEWDRRIDRYLRERASRTDEEDDDFDSEEN